MQLSMSLNLAIPTALCSGHCFFPPRACAWDSSLPTDRRILHRPLTLRSPHFTCTFLLYLLLYKSLQFLNTSVLVFILTGRYCTIKCPLNLFPLGMQCSQQFLSTSVSQNQALLSRPSLLAIRVRHLWTVQYPGSSRQGAKVTTLVFKNALQNSDYSPTHEIFTSTQNFSRLA